MREVEDMKRFRNKGFTLIELLVVMGIMILLMSIGAAGYFGIRRGAEMRAAVSTVRTALMLGRQQAVTKRQKVRVEFVSAGTTNLVRVSIEQPGGVYQTVHQETRLPAGIQYAVPPSTVVFAPSGTAGTTAPVDVVLQERVAQASGIKVFSTVRVWPLTGITKVQ